MRRRGPAVFEILRSVGFLAAYRDYYERTPDKLGPNVRANVELGLTFSASDVAWASAEHVNVRPQVIANQWMYVVNGCPSMAFG